MKSNSNFNLTSQEPTSSINDTSSPKKVKWLSIVKAVAYLAFVLIGSILVTMVAKAVFHASLFELAQRNIELQVVRAALLFIGVVVFPTIVMLKIGKDLFAISGWQGVGKLKMFIWGGISGTLLLTTIAIIMWINGNLVLSYNTFSVPKLIYTCLLSIILWLLLAAGEEGLHRGYAFIQVSQAVSFWVTALASSLWFMWGHVGNKGETTFGVLATGLIALVLAYSLLKTGSLWFALGFHASWNFMQSYIFGFNNSGNRTPVSLFVAKISGSEYLTGGSAGPEGSVLVLPAIVVLVLIVIYISCPIIKTDESNKLSRSIES